ncbi:MAG: hypothetical protein JNM96_07985 [Bacteroidia bacterium]|nr:hypothetical protein [Bacteroidia bacterium]
MKKSLLIILVCLIVKNTKSQENNSIVLEGLYNGKGILIKNSFGTGGIGYCVIETKVNGKTTKDEINANIFQIDLPSLGLKMGEKVKVEIISKKGCTPTTEPLILNPGALLIDKSLVETSLKLNGNFKWQNLFIVNPKILKKDEYSIKDIRVNGKRINIDLKKDIIEINLMSMQLNNDEKVSIEIKFISGEDPIILNPEDI